MKKILLEKLKESLQAVLPIGGVILLVHFTIVSVPLGTIALMGFGMVTLIIGLTLFSLGTEMAMMPMGVHIGSALLKSKNLALLIGGCFVFGFIVTVAEPDLQVMSKQVPSVPNFILLAGVAGGVGLFLVGAMIRVLFRLRLSYMLIVMYVFTFGLAIFSSDYLAVAFDASAVTTGPITVPFLLALGAGVAGVSGGKGSEEDNFGICAICSVGPILAVLITGLFFDSGSSGFAAESRAAVESFGELLQIFSIGLEHSFFDVLMVIVPIVGMFGIFQLTHIRLPRTELVKIGVGILYLVVGLTIFLTGVNEGFLPAGKFLGEAMGALDHNWIAIPVSLVIGACVVVAEPAVHVLTRQVEEITNGAISKKMLLWGMAAGVGLALTLAMTRVLFEISVWWIFLPGYIIATVLTFFVPPIFVGIGFDSGGVAAGAMSAAFVLPFTLGVCDAVGGNIMVDAFGVVGMISMMPPITIQIVGVLYNLKVKRTKQASVQPVASIHEKLDELL
ncbi:hypothetical protein FACS1894204_05740 [Synergistales bacterium]|nr:hypothetical protein FACS1894204_05740 [Synergistales bacterium]